METPHRPNDVPPIVRAVGAVVVVLGLLVLACGAIAGNVGIILVGVSGVVFGGAGLLAQQVPERNRSNLLWIGMTVAGAVLVITGWLTADPIRVLVGCNLLIPGAMGLLLIPPDAKPAFPWMQPALFVAFPVSLFIASQSERAGITALIGLCAVQVWLYISTARQTNAS
jgi:hypothetical protein